MMAWVKRWAAGMAAVAALGASMARADGLPIAPEGIDLRAVGRVNAAGFSRRMMCSGTLIAPDRVLTAAHCVVRGDRPVRLEDLHFVAGWARGEAVAHRRVTEVIVHEEAYASGPLNPAYRSGGAGAGQPDHRGRAPLPMAAFDGGPHGLAGYQATRPHLIGASASIARGRPAKPAQPSAPAASCPDPPAARRWSRQRMAGRSGA